MCVWRDYIKYSFWRHNIANSIAYNSERGLGIANVEFPLPHFVGSWFFVFFVKKNSFWRRNATYIIYTQTPATHIYPEFIVCLHDCVTVYIIFIFNRFSFFPIFGLSQFRSNFLSSRAKVKMPSILHRLRLPISRHTTTHFHGAFHIFSRSHNNGQPYTSLHIHNDDCRAIECEKAAVRCTTITSQVPLLSHQHQQQWQLSKRIRLWHFDATQEVTLSARNLMENDAKRMPSPTPSSCV